LILFLIYGYVNEEAEMANHAVGYNYSASRTLVEVIIVVGQDLFGAIQVLALVLFTVGALWSTPVEFIIGHLGLDVSNGKVFAGRAISLLLAVIFLIVNCKSLQDKD